VDRQEYTEDEAEGKETVMVAGGRREIEREKERR
jgi:hypothetical protein